MAWTLRIKVLGEDPPKIFDIADDDKRLVTLYKAGHPLEYASTAEKVGEQIWKKVLQDGAYIDVAEERGIIIPADKILEIEVRKA
ncbi:MAG: hypothetical protein WBG50_07505 [Desulfomonilaceae bacterium]